MVEPEIPVTGFEAEAQVQSGLGIEFTFLCVPAAVRGMKEHCAETVSCWRLWLVQDSALC